MQLLKTNETNFAKVVVYETEAPSVEILGFGDFHIGATDFSEELLYSIPEQFPNAYLVLVGDYLDFALKNSLGNIYEATMQPDEQIAIFDKFLEKFRDRILGGVSGNHDYRLKSATGIDIARLLFDKYNIPYFDTTMIIDVNLKGHAHTSTKRLNYAIALHHGSSGGRFPEKSARQGRYFKDYLEDVDVYVSGHTHQANLLPLRINRYDRKNKVVKPRTIHMVTVPSLIPEEKYAQRKMFPPMPLTYSLVRLMNGITKQVVIETYDFTSKKIGL